MSRKVFLSFLGTNDYKPCKYVSGEKGESRVVKYVQDAILNLYCQNFTKDDFAYIFLTQPAENKNWETLQTAIGTKSFNIVPVTNIPEGYSETDIWKIFEIVFNYLSDNDEVILDVTHGFRSLPMLEIVLLNYAKSLKNIKVKYILYGAFEALGSPRDIDERIPNPENRKAPLLDITAFSAIQAWTFGAESFIQTGNTKTITELSLENIKPILKESKGSDFTASNIRSLMKSLEQIETTIKTNRGKTINHGNWIQTAHEALSNLTIEERQVFAPVKPILKQVEDKLASFNQMPHWEASVDWCIEHGLAQQGITQLQEGIISFLCEQHGLKSNDLTDREIVTQALNIYDKSKDESEWHKPASENKEKVIEIIKSKFVEKHKGNFSRLSSLRNDINHGGYRDDAINDGSQFKKKLAEIFDEFKNIRGRKEAEEEKSKSFMLLNLSNHPSANWPPGQWNTAIEQFGSVQDLPFPQINPNANADEIEQLAEEYETKVRLLNPSAIHIMGEMTFTYKLVNRLKAIGISCIASTTERTTEEENGTKTSVFKFVRFRSY